MIALPSSMVSLVTPRFNGCYLLLLLLAMVGQAQGQSMRTMIFDELKNHSTNGHYILTLLHGLPNEFTIDAITITVGDEQNPDVWVYGQSREGVLTSLGTVVHESTHGLNDRLAFQLLAEREDLDFRMTDEYAAFFMDPEQTYLVQRTEVFSSHLLKDAIPKRLRTLRYDPYIVPASNLGSQVLGVYGLMDEWCAYLQGTRTSLDVLKSHLENERLDKPSLLLDLVSQVAGSYYAYYEFKYYILKYLEMASQDYPEFHRAILANEPLRAAYVAIDHRFAELITEFHETVDQLIEDLPAETNWSISKREGYFMVNMRGVGLFEDVAALLKGELEKSYLVQLEQSFVVAD